MRRLGDGLFRHYRRLTGSIFPTIQKASSLCQKFDLAVIHPLLPLLWLWPWNIWGYYHQRCCSWQRFFKNPGLHRTLLGDGLASLFAGLIGGPANTTYSENTGVLATTKNHNPALLELPPSLPIILGFWEIRQHFKTIPPAPPGRCGTDAFRMIASVGIRTLAEANLVYPLP